MIISIHVPKCAGTSFRHVIHGLYGDRIWFNYGVIFTREQARPELVPPGTEFIHGHFLGDAFDDLFPGSRLVAWVRHPVERLVSNYFHFLRSPDMRDDCCRALHEQKLTLLEFSDLDWMRNETTRYLARKPPEAFAFIGIAERFAESIGVFGRTFGFGSLFAVPRVNVNPERSEERYPLTTAQYDAILERNRDDLEFYERAVRRLDADLVASGIGYRVG